MAVAVQLDFAGGTLEQYDRVIAEMGCTPGRRRAPGGLFHWVTKTDDGIRVVDVWQDRRPSSAARRRRSARRCGRQEST
jgi:hypothetical protein